MRIGQQFGRAGLGFGIMRQPAQLRAVQVQKSQRLPQDTLAQGLVGGEDFQLTRKTAQIGQQTAPQLARLPPAIVGGVVAKAEEQRKRDAEDGERDAFNMRQHAELVIEHHHNGGNCHHAQQR